MADLRIEVVDLATGRREHKNLRAGDYVIICTEPCKSEVVLEADGGAVHHVRVSGRTPRPGGDLWHP